MKISRIEIARFLILSTRNSLRFGFVTFAEVQSAYEVIEKYRSDQILSKYDVRFGGRRRFCKQNYADLGECLHHSMKEKSLIVYNFLL